MNSPHVAFYSSLKLNQLRAAREAGFRVPETLVSTNADILRSFWKRHNGKIVTKDIFRGHLYSTTEEHGIFFTNRVAKEHLASLPLGKCVPVLFQVEIQKKREFRIVVIGTRVFSCVLGNSGQEIDWRRTSNATQDSVPISLPKEVCESSIKTLQNLGLSFGALDVIEDQDGQFYFLEVNQQGSWKWMETELHMPISQAIVQHLVSK